MLNKTAITWTERTWNPVRGCDWISPGCDNCYAREDAARREGKCKGYEAGFGVRLAPHKLPEPLLVAEPGFVFVNSTSDIFHHAVPTDYITEVAQVMAATPWLTFQVLTKRHQRMVQLLTGDLAWAAGLPNIWWGVSVENRRNGIPRIDALRQVNTRNRFLSIEPLLEDLGPLDLTGLSWVIVGGESGPNCRPMDPAWARNIREQCREASIPFFFKQNGGPGREKGGNLLDGRVWQERPERRIFPVAAKADCRALVTAIRARFGVSAGSTLLIDPAPKKKPSAGT